MLSAWSFALDAGRGSIRADALLPESKAKAGTRYRLQRETQPSQSWRAVGRTVMVNGLSMMLVVAWNESTAEVKYWITNRALNIF